MFPLVNMGIFLGPSVFVRIEVFSASLLFFAYTYSLVRVGALNPLSCASISYSFICWAVFSIGAIFPAPNELFVNLGLLSEVDEV